jgi:hypothetical protein
VVVSPIQHHLQQTAVSKSVQDQNDREVLKKRFPAHFLREKMNARTKKAWELPKEFWVREEDHIPKSL